MSSSNNSDDRVTADSLIEKSDSSRNSLSSVLDILNEVKSVESKTLTYSEALDPGTKSGDNPAFDAQTFADQYDFVRHEDGRSATLDSYVPNLASTDPETSDLRRSILIDCGLDPDQCRIVGGVSISSSKWTNQGHKNRAQRYRYTIEFINPMVHDITEDIAWALEERLIKSIDDGLPASRRVVADKSATGDRVMNLVLADLQVGKTDGGGTEGIVERVSASIAEFARQVIIEKPDAVAMFWPGDLCEGNVSQNGKNMGYQTHLTITEQVRVLQRIIGHAVKVVAPYCPELHVIVVNGNHDEAQRNPINTKAGDGWATEVTRIVSDKFQEISAETNGKYDHVHFHCPPDNRSYVTVTVKKSTYLVVHGHQWRKRGQVGALDWWKNHAFNMGSGAMAHFMIHGHQHTSQFYQDGPRTVCCAASSDGGSDWFDNLNPGSSVIGPGGSMFTSEGPKWSNYSIV